ncbi:leucine-rich repeat extensin-like protein 5 [Penaeus chinensis]|uniref:leucine-rich repeat extensin-like protein 5 n=1 Tax=Penaeus chinensis TaxID=139456 RepID=UPI001FB71862|nr:leucine-rich repeat extensin-like protein 5 [Penaeus chinensis]
MLCYQFNSSTESSSGRPSPSDITPPPSTSRPLAFDTPSFRETLNRHNTSPQYSPQSLIPTLATVPPSSAFSQLTQHPVTYLPLSPPTHPLHLSHPPLTTPSPPLSPSKPFPHPQHHLLNIQSIPPRSPTPQLSSVNPLLPSLDPSDYLIIPWSRMPTFLGSFSPSLRSSHEYKSPYSANKPNPCLDHPPHPSPNCYPAPPNISCQTSHAKHLPKNHAVNRTSLLYYGPLLNPRYSRMPPHLQPQFSSWSSTNITTPPRFVPTSTSIKPQQRTPYHFSRRFLPHVNRYSKTFINVSTRYVINSAKANPDQDVVPEHAVSGID